MLTVGTKLGPYEIGPPLGAGGMGEVEPFCGRERSAFFAPRMFLRGGSPQAKSRPTRGISC
jgi:hypothetical protein